MKRVYLLQFIIIAAVWGTALCPQASLLRAMNLGELVALSDAIVVGKVVSQSAAWDLQHRRIISTIEVVIEESWKGPEATDRHVTIVQPGGSVGDIEMTVQGMPSFSVGERSLLFLQGQHHLQVVGMGQGKRALAWNDQSKQWQVNSPDMEGVIEVGPGAKLRQAKRQTPILLDDLREQVMRAIANAP
jgi:hypothetical protein